MDLAERKREQKWKWSTILLVALYNNILCPIINIDTGMHCFSVVTEVQSDVSHIHNMGVMPIINPHGRKA